MVKNIYCIFTFRTLGIILMIIEKYLFSPFTVAIALVVGGFLMIMAENNLTVGFR